VLAAPLSDFAKRNSGNFGEQVELIDPANDGRSSAPVPESNAPGLFSFKSDFTSTAHRSWNRSAQPARRQFPEITLCAKSDNECTQHQRVDACAQIFEIVFGDLFVPRFICPTSSG